jgi:peptidoglycan lytic transglycosylase
MPMIDLKPVNFPVFLLCFMVIIGIYSSEANSDNSTVKHQKDPLISSGSDTETSLFLKAESALELNQTAQFEELLTKLRYHPLIEYMHRDWLIQQLSNSRYSPNLQEKIQTFLKRNHNQVVSRKLRFRWLNFLADTKQNKLFTHYYQPQRSNKLRCHYLNLQLQNGSPLVDLSPKIERIWFTGKSLPKQCDPLFAAWKEKGELTEPRIWHRMQLAADNKQYQLVRYLSRMLSDDSKPAALWLEKISRNPSRLKQRPPKHLEAEYTQSIILEGLEKLAWQKPEDAIKLWKQYHPKLSLSNNQKLQLQRVIGLSLAIKGSANSKDWLESAELSHDGSVKQWLLSNRLLQSDWSAIHRYTKENAKNESIDKWHFWNAISASNLGRKETAKQQLTLLANNRSYYGFLAASILNTQLNFNHKEANVTNPELSQLTQRDSAKRAKALLDLGRYSEARSEWNHLMKSLSKRQYLAAAHLAHDWGWDHQSILAFAKSKEFDDIVKRFPLFKVEQYQAAASLHGIPVSWAYAITRQESAFKKDATSSAGAQGLMQLKPSTAKMVAKQKLKGSPIANLSSRSIARKKLLHRPNLNINLGVAHLKQMLDYYGGNHVLATAAYNAGPSAVDRWLKDNEIAHSITWIEQIPFKETREYVKNVLTYQEIYAELIDDDSGFIRNIKDITIPTSSKTSTQVSTR